MNNSDRNAIDVQSNRNAKKYSTKVQLLRVFWHLAQPFFRLSPRIFWPWRRQLLRLFGAKIGTDVHIYPTVRISMPWNFEIEDYAAIGDFAIIYALGRIRVGARTTISQYAHICAGTHDLSSRERPLLKSPIDIGDDVWIAAGAFVGPGVTVEARAVVGAHAVVTKRVSRGQVVVGNPASAIRDMSGEIRAEHR